MAASEDVGAGPGRWSSIRTRLRALASKLLKRAAPWAVGFGACTFVLEMVDGAFPAWLLRIATAFSTGIAVGLLAHVCIEELSTPANEHDRLAKDIVDTAQALHDDQRHRAVIDFRASASIVLQLLGNWTARADLGRIALRSSQAIGDRLAQASILLDDLGWSTFALGDVQLAMTKLEDAIGLLNTMLDVPRTPAPDRDQLLDLRAKARRHLVAVKTELRDFASASSILEAARRDARQLSEPFQGPALAKLDYAESYVLHHELSVDLGPEGRVLADSPSGRRLEAAVARCRGAIMIFRGRANLEWEARTADLLPSLLRRYAQAWEVDEAKAMAAAIQRQRARNRKTLNS